MKSNPHKPERPIRRTTFSTAADHFGIFDQAHNGRVPGGMALAEHFKMETRQDGTLPASDGAGGFVSRDKGLSADGRTLPQKRLAKSECRLGRATPV